MRFLFTATSRHTDCISFSLNGTFNDFLIIFLWLLSAQGQCKLIKIVDAVCSKNKTKKNAFVVHLNALPT